MVSEAAGATRSAPGSRHQTDYRAAATSQIFTAPTPPRPLAGAVAMACPEQLELLAFESRTMARASKDAEEVAHDALEHEQDYVDELKFWLREVEAARESFCC